MAKKYKSWQFKFNLTVHWLKHMWWSAFSVHFYLQESWDNSIVHMNRYLNGLNTLSFCKGCSDPHSPDLQICPCCVPLAANTCYSRWGLVFLIAFHALALLTCHTKIIYSIFKSLQKHWVHAQDSDFFLLLFFLSLDSESRKKKVEELRLSSAGIIIRSTVAQRQNPAWSCRKKGQVLQMGSWWRWYFSCCLLEPVIHLSYSELHPVQTLWLHCHCRRCQLGSFEAKECPDDELKLGVMVSLKSIIWSACFLLSEWRRPELDLRSQANCSGLSG